jgi:hypothetical protein
MWFHLRAFLEYWPLVVWEAPDLWALETGEVVASIWKLWRFWPWR